MYNSNSLISVVLNCPIVSLAGLDDPLVTNCNITLSLVCVATKNFSPLPKDAAEDFVSEVPGKKSPHNGMGNAIMVAYYDFKPINSISYSVQFP